MRGISSALLVMLALSGCGIIDKKLLGSSIPRHGSLIPATNIQLTPGYATTLEAVALTAVTAAALYYIYEPLDANWEGADQPVSNDVYRLSMRMKRFHTGGDGEAMMVARRYAEQLRVARGASAYTIVEYAEGIESSTPIARRVAEAIVKLKDPLPPVPAEIVGPPASAANSGVVVS